jgi:predicted nucleic acid-binding protein
VILIDTNVLIALVNERDALHARAVADSRSLKSPFGVIDAVLVESLWVLSASYLRRRLWQTLLGMSAEHINVESAWWPTIAAWMDKYDTHSPDLCDAVLLQVSSQKHAKIWTYDKEFRTVWKDSSGQHPQLVG